MVRKIYVIECLSGAEDENYIVRTPDGQQVVNVSHSASDLCDFIVSDCVTVELPKNN